VQQIDLQNIRHAVSAATLLCSEVKEDIDYNH